MIFDRLENISRYKGIYKNLDLAIEWITKTNLNQLSKEKHIIKENDVFALHMEVDSYGDQSAQYESHQIYADLQVILDPEEKLYFAQESDLEKPKTQYNKESNFTLFEIDNQNKNLLHPSTKDFLFFFPKEGHVPKYLRYNRKLNKIVIKVKIDW
ncbi:YhcH/YjgK/YiaL family protein [Mesomycoplasma hyorhinis]|uniref:YhcH/YjgK/YiaL family protein n=1 Tax=Mesomycoplasma hyorhinis TaxID=2100 RepID=UPI001C0461D3|nr:YhcH/YjgK/YiaL family protein [Mesomycoplasma hyorhinis]